MSNIVDHRHKKSSVSISHLYDIGVKYFTIPSKHADLGFDLCMILNHWKCHTSQTEMVRILSLTTPHETDVQFHEEINDIEPVEVVHHVLDWNQ